jgi:hypothetical protein
VESIDAVMPALDALIAECAKTWPPSLTSVGTTPSNQSAAALAALIERARDGGVSTLPYLHDGKNLVFWVSFGSDAKSLLEYSEDLRSWVMAGYGTFGDLEFARPGGSGHLAQIVYEASPAGYLRWTSEAKSLLAILSVLGRMHTFLQGIPQVRSLVAPSLHILRFRFVSALRLGEWDVAESIIDEIDRWNLEQAHKTMQMRLRVLGESGNHSRLLEVVEAHHLWSLSHPTRVAMAILDAFVHEVLRQLETSRSPGDVCEGLRPWYSKLVNVLTNVVPAGDYAPLFAYIACLDHDDPSARALLPYLTEPLSSFVRARFALPIEEVSSAVNTEATTVANIVSPTVAAPPNRGPGSIFWQSLQAAVRQGSAALIDLRLSELDARVLEDVDFLEQAPDALLELISDPAVDNHVASKNGLQELITALTDISLSMPGFPSVRHLDLYLSLAEALVYVRGSAAREEDAHLLHGLLAAIANLSPSAARRCGDLLRSWWSLRPIHPRLDWLVAVLDSLAPLHPDPGSLMDLWSEAVALAIRKRLALSASQFRTWQRVAGLLEVDAETANSNLSALRPTAESALVDVLKGTNWRRIAIVSLQEGAAREAASELKARTGADVVLVTGLVQDGLTKVAQTADVILFVWAACSHAVYRAFDAHRERLAYVQGTGASSIVAAAERQAAKKAEENA